ncbi:hypothetical protein AAG570_012891 [Ranatra chinensis]|uniref:ANK_REP_REGION domain-containing protein n=1 Tax=Ranatra chinensis TaxID=642074 RepID=A0ABD0YFA6_9HEMI
MKRLYGLSDSENLESLYDRCKFLVDLFLNTPDKSLNETPLHFASKFGAVDVVEVLLSYPQCKRKQINKFHQTPLDIACSRVCVEAINCKRKIVMLLEDCYYVPVLRSNDVSIQAFVGEPFTLELNPVRFVFCFWFFFFFY